VNGNRDGPVEAGTGGAIREEIVAWQQLSAAAFLRGSYLMASSSVTIAAPHGIPTDVFGGYLGYC